MDFNTVFQQMFNENGDNKNFNPMQYADMISSLRNCGDNNSILVILLLLLLCCCGNYGFNNNGSYGQGNSQCFKVCCKRKKPHYKKYKTYECYLDPCSCSNYGCNNYNGFGGYGCSWIYVLFLIIIFCLGDKCNCSKDNSRSCASNVINVDTVE